MAILPSSGFAANGKPIFSWAQAANQLTRTGNSWSATLDTPATITYAFRAAAGSLPSGVSGFQQFNAAQIQAAEAALQLWADVANIIFVRIGIGTSGAGAYSNSATILFANYTTETSPASAFAFLPSPGAKGSTSAAGDIWVDVSQAENAAPIFGDFGPHVLAHEIGHAIGLTHPGNYDGGSPTYAANAAYWQDARMFTIMSYFGSTNSGGNLPAFSWGPQLHDIAAAQRLYGANMTTRTGDTVYGFNSTAGRSLFDIAAPTQGAVFSIWDAGGVDTLDLSGYSQNADIDLREESFTSAGPTPDAGPAKYNISIARGVVIENAIGGAGNDTITGNAAANALLGGLGADALLGAAGSDTLDGGGANDALAGGAGADRLIGGAGVDMVTYVDATSGVTIRLWNGTGANNLAAGDVLIEIENVVGSTFADLLFGADAVANRLEGGAGGDYLNGLSGDDFLVGAAGADTIDGGTGVDIASYADAPGSVTIRLWNGTGSGAIAAGDVLLNIENVGGTNFADILIGADNAANWLGGGLGGDYLNGLSGNDTLVGGGGNDTLAGGAGNDVFEFATGAGADRIADFAAGAVSEDIIRLVGLGPMFDSFAEILAVASQVGADAVLALGSASITLVGVQVSILSADDFIFG